MTSTTFRAYCSDDFRACIELFDANCPEFLAPIERKDYVEFLEDAPSSYEVCVAEGHVIGTFGLSGDSRIEKRIDWIMVEPQSQGMGVGAKIMQRVVDLGRASKTKTVGLATSQMVAPFFQKYGAATLSVTKDGWAPGYDRVDMVLVL